MMPLQTGASFQLGNVGATEFSSLALDTLSHGSRTQQSRIHEKESWEEVSDMGKREVLIFTIIEGTLAGGDLALGAVMNNRVY